MQISPWDIYWIMQLDSIKAGTITVFIITLIVALLIWGGGAIATDCGTNNHFEPSNDLKWTGIKKVVKVSGTICALSLLFSSALPSSKTAAAMVVIPAIVNNQSVQAEAKELYSLAKQGFAELVKPDAKVSTEETTEE